MPSCFIFRRINRNPYRRRVVGMTMKSIVCFALVLILTGIALLQLRSIRLGLSSREWNVARGRIVRAFVDDDGNDGEGGELLHSANVRYAYRVGRKEYASSRLSYGSTRHLKLTKRFGCCTGSSRAVRWMCTSIPARRSVPS